MSEPDPGQLSLMEGERDSGLPLIYVASPLSHLDEDGRRLVDAWCELISHAVVETTMQAEEQWPVRLHAPITWSAPWKGDGRSPNEVYQANIGLVMGAAALVLVGYRGGSLGAGQEFSWACTLRLPILYLQPTGEPVSRQIAGTPADLTIAEFQTAHQLSDTVRRWLLTQRAAIEDHPRRARNREIVLTHLSRRLRSAWDDAGAEERAAAAAVSRLHPERIQLLLSQPLSLALAGFGEVLALLSALGVDIWRQLGPESLPELSHRQLSALMMAADEYEWSPSEALTLHQAARQELALPAIRRLPLVTAEDWVRFREAYAK